MITEDEYLTAARLGDLHIINEYIDHNRDIFVKDYFNKNSLMLAAEYGHTDVVNRL